jgi:hypothetical protein
VRTRAKDFIVFRPRRTITKQRIDALGREIVLRNLQETATFFSEEISNGSMMVEATNLMQ